MKREEIGYVEYSIFYLILFFILREWLVPIIELTKTGELTLLLAFVALCCVLNVIEVPLWISWLIKGLYIAWFLVHVYTDNSLFSADGMTFLVNDFSTNVGVILSGDFSQVTNPFRSMLFFLLMWMLIYLIDYWLKVRFTVFYFLMLTVFFIATLDTFTPYDGKMAIVTVMLLGLMLTALLYMKRLIIQTGTYFPFHKYAGYLLPVVVAIGVAGVVAVILPKAAPQWPDPVPYIKSLSEGSGGFNKEKVSKVGLGDNDQQLGGAFEDDDTLVFTVEADKQQYWRVEMKDFYNSKGWISSMEDAPSLEMLPEDARVSIWPEEDAEVSTAKVSSHIDRNYLLQAYGLAGYNYPEEDVSVYLHPLTERLTTRMAFDGEDTPLTQYDIFYQTPAYSYASLKQPAVQSELATIDTRYLQLPDTLPDRVVDLARSITEQQALPYDKAREIEQYFRRNGFWYETKNVAVPTEEQDYVDQFLFETKRGYCDNFSTSMVVMLRSVGIPARWVKGFAIGGEVGRSEDGQRIFEVRNNDAHSWVEAYIDGVGWMTFEPTIGFSAPSQIEYDLNTTPDVTPEQLQEQEKDRTEREETKKQADKKKEERSFTWLYIVLSVLAIAAIIAFFIRRKWLPKLHIVNQRRKAENKAAVQSAYKVLLKQLEYEGLVRAPDETLTRFAQRVDDYFETNDMSIVTDVYEKSIYSKNPEDFSYEKIQESWEYLINRTSS